MSRLPATKTPQARLASAAPGRLRIRIDASRGEGKLGRLADELERMPDTRSVRPNHAARSVTVKYDPNQVTAPTLLSRLERLGLIALDLADPSEWPELLAGELVPLAEDPRTLPGRLNRHLRRATAGGLDLLHLTVAVLLLSAGLQVRNALLRGQAVPWLRVLAYVLAAVSIWTRRRDQTIAE
jgi:hypothetical protein